MQRKVNSIIARLDRGATPQPESVLTSFPKFRRTILRDWEHGSGVDPELIDGIIEFVEDTGRWEPQQVLEIRVPTQWVIRKPHNYEALAVIRNEDGSLWQAKALNPPLDEKGKKCKYLNPKKPGQRAFMPSVTVRIWREIARRNGVEDALPDWVKRAYRNGNHALMSGSTGFGVDPTEASFWKWVAQFPEVETILTEGAKKTGNLLSRGYCAIGLNGCWGAVLTNEWIGGEKVKKAKPELAQGLEPIMISGRKVAIALDQDLNPKTVEDVSAAIDCTGRVLSQLGCEVSIASWDGENGLCKGVDDLIVNRGTEAWEKAHSGAESFSQWAICRQLAREIRRKPDLNIGDREFVEVASELPREGLLILQGSKGSGKSTLIRELTKGQKWISITHSMALARGQAEDWGGVFINDGDLHGSTLLKNGMPVSGASVCVPSLLKVAGVDADILVLDETTAVLAFLLGSKLANKNGIRPILLTEFERRVRDARMVIIADADLTEEVIQHIETLRGERGYFVRSERKSLTYDANSIQGSQKAAIALLKQRAEVLEMGKLIYIHTDAKNRAEYLAEMLGEDKTLLITADTTGGAVEAGFLASKGRGLPRLVEKGIRFIVCSPSLTEGFSIQNHTDLIDSVWGFYSGCSITAHQIAQGLDRVRDASVPRFVWTAQRGSAYSKLSKAQSVAAFLREFKQLRTASARLVSLSLTPETLSATDEIDWKSQNLRTLASLEVRRNRGMAALRETLVALLKKEGKRVHSLVPNLTKEDLDAAGRSLQDAAEAVNDRRFRAVEAADDLTEAQAEALATQTDPLTPEQVRALEKFYIRQFYRLDAVTVADVRFDRKGRTRSEIKNLEATLSPEVATEMTASSINQNPQTPQDWNPIAVRAWLLEQSGAAKLIRAIVAGEVEVLSSDLVDPIADFIREHGTEFRVGFGFKSIDKLSSQQIVGEILSRHCIKTKRRGNRNNHRYEVQRADLDKVLAIIERRRKPVTPYGNFEENRQGVIVSNPPIMPNSPTASEGDRGVLSPRAWSNLGGLEEFVQQTIPIEDFGEVAA